MKRPSFQFYPDDWTGNSNLKRCTHEEKGIWMDVLCVLHDQEEYGVARWPLAEIAQAVGTTKAKLKRLVDKGVLKGVEAGDQCAPFIFVPRSGRKDGAPVTLVEQQDGPIWYSSRMVEDEYKRRVRGGLDDAPKDAPKPAPKGAPDSSPKGGIGEGIDEAPKDAPKDTPDPSPLAGAPGQAPRAAPSSPSPSPINTSVPTDVGTGTDVPPADPPPPAPPVEPTNPAPPPGLEPQEAIFQVAVPWLVARGMPDRSARSLLGGAVKQLGPEGAWELASECIRLEVLEPAAWLSKALNERIATRGSGQPARRKGSRADDRAAWSQELREVLAEPAVGQRTEKNMGVIDVSDC